MAEQKRRSGSLRRRVTGWLGAILAVSLVSIGVATAVGRWTSDAFDAMLSDNSLCYTVQEALAAETRAFTRYVREPSQENEADYQDACAAAAESLAALPFDYTALGEERYARTWNLLQGYAGYQQYRDAFLQLPSSAENYVDQLYRVMGMQDHLAQYALRLTQATLEQEDTLYRDRANQMDRLPGLYGGLFLLTLVLMLVLLDVLSRAVVRPLLALARAAGAIAENDFSGQDLPVSSQDEVGQLTGTFNRMKRAMQDHLATLNALHQEEMRNLALEKDLDHTRMEVLKSQVNPHFLFNTLNMISCMARLEDAQTTDQMIVSLGNLFRHNLRTKQQEVPLEEELEAVEDYIYLQQMRFDGRITVEKQILVDPAAVRLPSFTLQPVIENAFSHGLKACEEGGRILLRVWQQGQILYITVADNGKGMDEAEQAALQEKIRHSEQTGKSIGLGNIFRRIHRLYPEDGKMQVFSRAGHGTVVRFEIPQRNREEEP